MDMNLMQAISDYGLAIVGCVGAGVAAWKLLHFLLRDDIVSLKKQDSIIIDLIDKTSRLEIIIQRMDSKLDTLLQKRSNPLLKGDRAKREDDE